jgi:uncharacterized protein (TIGR04222 family)
MSWIFDNPVANMYGPAFLVLIGLLLTAAGIAMRWMVVAADRSSDLEPMKISKEVDPFRIAYLRGGDTEVIRTAVVDLVEQGRIVQSSKQTGVAGFFEGKSLRWIVSSGDAGATRHDSRIHQIVLEHFKSPRTAESIFTTEIKSQIKQETEPWHQWSQKEQLIIDRERIARITSISKALSAGLVLFSAYKLIAAILHNRYNVGFLVAMLVVCPFVIMISTTTRRLSKRGQSYLRDLKTAYRPLQNLRESENANQATQFAFGDVSLPLLAMGIFGVQALRGSSMDPLCKSYLASASASSGCGSSFSASHCGSGGGDGGAASCGGGGGGGCGGCGGGGCGS